MINKLSTILKQRLNKRSVDEFMTRVHKSGLICDHDKFKEHNLEVIGRNNKYRKYFHLIWRLLHNIHFTLCFINLVQGNKDSPRYYMDVHHSKYMGGIKHFIYPIAMFMSLISVVFIKVFNFNNNNTYYWLKVFEILKRYEILRSLGIWNNKDMATILNIIRLGVLVIPYLICSMLILMFMYSFFLIINIYEFPDILIYGFPSVLIYLLYGYSILNIGSNCVLCLFTVCGYSQIKLKAINKMIINLTKNSLIINRKINQLIEEHNSICIQIYKFNSFWKNLIQAILYLVFPLTLLLLHQSLFGKFGNISMPLLLLMCFLVCFGTTICFAYYLSNISKESIKSFNLLIKLKLNVKNLSRNQSIKVNFV